MEVERAAEAEAEAEVEVEAEVVSMDAKGAEGGAEGGAESGDAPPLPSAGGVPTEAQLREHIVSDLQTFSEGTLRQAIDRLGEHFDVDVRASGLKPVIKRLLGEVLS